MIKIKNALFYSGNLTAHKLYRNKILTLKRINRKNYYHKYFEENIVKIEKIWEGNWLLDQKRDVRKVDLK